MWKQGGLWNVCGETNPVWVLEIFSKDLQSISLFQGHVQPRSGVPWCHGNIWISYGSFILVLIVSISWISILICETWLYFDIFWCILMMYLWKALALQEIPINPNGSTNSTYIPWIPLVIPPFMVGYIIYNYIYIMLYPHCIWRCSSFVHISSRQCSPAVLVIGPFQRRRHMWGLGRPGSARSHWQFTGLLQTTQCKCM